MPGHDGQGDWVPAQDPVQTVVRRDHVEQPADRGGLELLAAGRVHPGRPPRRYICAHLDSLPDYRTHILSGYHSCSTATTHTISTSHPAPSPHPPLTPQRGRLRGW